jgi:tripeptide aminopeptidase
MPAIALIIGVPLLLFATALPALAQTAGASPAPARPGPDDPHRAEIARIADDPAVRAAFRIIEALEEQSISDLIQLTEIAAPPFMEAARAAAFAEMLRAAGADSVWIDAAGNVIGLRQGLAGDRAVALDGHLDTVFPPDVDVSVRVRGDTLFAPGIGDDTRGLIVVRNVLRAMVDSGVRTRDDVLFVGTVGEEGLGDLRGVKHLFEEGPGRRRISAFISVDGGDERRVKLRAVGSVRYRVTFRGAGGHSYGSFGLANPQHALARAASRFVETAATYTEHSPARTTFNIGRIGGGTSINSIPHEGWMEVDLRSLDPIALAGIDSVFLAAVRYGVDAEDRHRRQGPRLTVDVERVGFRPAAEAAPDTPLILRALAVTAHLGLQPVLGSGSTNANVPMALGIPATTIGRGGRGGGAHSLDEWWLPDRPELAVQRAFLIVLAEAGHAAGPD